MYHKSKKLRIIKQRKSVNYKVLFDGDVIPENYSVVAQQNYDKSIFDKIYCLLNFKSKGFLFVVNFKEKKVNKQMFFLALSEQSIEDYLYDVFKFVTEIKITKI